MINQQLQHIQKLGAFFRKHYTDWKINLLTDWRIENDIFIREIVHEGDGKILVYARTELPKATFDHFHQELANLKDRSIGDHFLFTKKDLIREPFEIFQEEGQWARRSKFKVEGFPLTITEYFTEAGLKCIQD